MRSRSVASLTSATAFRACSRARSDEPPRSATLRLRSCRCSGLLTSSRLCIRAPPYIRQRAEGKPPVGVKPPTATVDRGNPSGRVDAHEHRPRPPRGPRPGPRNPVRGATRAPARALDRCPAGAGCERGHDRGEASGSEQDLPPDPAVPATAGGCDPEVRRRDRRAQDHEQRDPLQQDAPASREAQPPEVAERPQGRPHRGLQAGSARCAAGGARVALARSDVRRDQPDEARDALQRVRGRAHHAVQAEVIVRQSALAHSSTRRTAVRSSRTPASSRSPTRSSQQNTLASVKVEASVA